MWLSGQLIMILDAFLPDLEDTLLTLGAIVFHAGFIGAGLSLWKFPLVNDAS